MNDYSVNLFLKILDFVWMVRINILPIKKLAQNFIGEFFCASITFHITLITFSQAH